jgi:hypothetical protein
MVFLRVSLLDTIAIAPFQVGKKLQSTSFLGSTLEHTILIISN